MNIFDEEISEHAELLIRRHGQARAVRPAGPGATRVLGCRNTGENPHEYVSGLAKRAIEDSQRRQSLSHAELVSAVRQRAAPAPSPATAAAASSTKTAAGAGACAVNFDLLEKRISNLNAHTAGSLSSHSHHGVVQLKLVAPVSVVVYKDAITFTLPPISSGPKTYHAFSFSSRRGKGVLGDLSAGFLPGFLRPRYPGGVELVAEFKKDQDLGILDDVIGARVRETQEPVSTGPDLQRIKQTVRTLGTAARPAQSTHTASPLPPLARQPRPVAPLSVQDQDDVDSVRSLFARAAGEDSTNARGAPVAGAGGLYRKEAPKPAITMDEFLSKLPETVIRGGHVLHVRKDVASELGVAPAPAPAPAPAAAAAAATTSPTTTSTTTTSAPAKPTPLTSIALSSEPAFQLRLRLELVSLSVRPSNVIIEVSAGVSVNDVVNETLRLSGMLTIVSASQLAVLRPGHGLLCSGNSDITLNSLGITGKSSLIFALVNE